MDVNWVALPGVLGVFLKIVAACTATTSAMFWVISARARVLKGPTTRMSVVEDDGSFTDIQATMQKQTLWNARAAYCAAISAICVVALAILDAAENGYEV